VSPVGKNTEKREKAMLEKMKDMVKQNDICVLATVSGLKPYCSLMAYASNDEGTEIYMVSHKNTQKYRNLTDNPNVSLLIDTRGVDKGPKRSKARALTVSGIFQQINEKENKDHIRAILAERLPDMREFAYHPDAEVFSIKATSFLLLEGLTNAYFESVT
jgi:nitroimidazol reductase NimA-like FMN-containing flavoprotein (pyridoxamine 5'-phosphate oxidase superfamily)